MIYNNLGIITGSLPTRRNLFAFGAMLHRPASSLQVSSIGGPGNDVFYNASSSSNLYVPVTDVTTTPFTPSTSDYFLCVDIDGPASIVLPETTIGRVYVVKDCDGDAATNPITITAIGSTIDGAASATINVNYGSLTFVFNGTEWSIE